MDLINANVQQGISSQVENLRAKPVSYGSSIVGRETVRFYSTGSSVYNSTQNRQLTIKLSSTNFLDPATATLNFQLKSGGDNQVGGAGQCPETDFGLACFQSVTLRVGGRIVENIENANDILRPLFYLNNDAEVVRNVGSLNGHYKFKTVKGQYTIVDSSNDVKGIDLGAETAYIGFDTNNSSSIALPGISNTILTNSSNLRNTTGYTVLPEGAVWIRGASSTNEQDNRLVNGLNKLGRFYSLRLADVFGLFRGSESYLPLRNMQQIQLDFVLADYQKCWINPLTFGLGSTSGPASTIAGTTNTDLNNYQIIAPYVMCDIIQPAQATIDLIDGMCASQEGFALVYDAFTTQKQTLNYSTQVTIQSSKSYSHVRDAYVFMQPSQTSNGSPCLDSSQYYYGSKHQSHTITVGSSSFPLVECDSTSASLFEVLKTVSNHDRYNGASILDYNLYTGSTAFTSTACKPFFPSLALGSAYNASTANKEASALQASCLPFESPSLFMIGQSFEKSIGRNKALSGINTRLTASQITLNLKLRELSDVLASASPNSAVALYSADVITGSAPVAFTMAVHYESLLLIQNNAIIVAD
jgi:hypothetical protein